MPSIGIENKEKKMKKAKKETVETPEPMGIEKKKTQKESKKRKALDTEVDAKPNSELEVQKTKKKSKKDKAEQQDEKNKKKNGQEEKPNAEPMSKKKSKKAKVEQEENKRNEEEEDEKNPNAISKFRISQLLRAKLKERKKKSLSPIEARTFDSILDGFDLLAQAPADQDNTLAFVLPILESLTNGGAEQSKKTGHRAPSVMVLLPTRDLAIQVLKEFGFYGGSLGLASCCIYGGSSHKAQTKKLKRGRVDIIVGTPGRVKDHIEKGNIDMTSLKFRVLGEADELWKEGLVEDVEFILGKVNDVTKVQTLLFSTHMPRFVEKIVSSRYLKSNYKEVELVSNERHKGQSI